MAQARTTMIRHRRDSSRQSPLDFESNSLVARAQYLLPAEACVLEKTKVPPCPLPLPLHLFAFVRKWPDLSQCVSILLVSAFHPFFDGGLIQTSFFFANFERKISPAKVRSNKKLAKDASSMPQCAGTCNSDMLASVQNLQCHASK